MLKKILCTLTMSILIISSLASCGSGSPNSENTTGSSNASVAPSSEKKVLKVGIPNVKATPEIANVSYTEIFDMMMTVQETLVDYDDNLTLIPLLLKNLPTVSDDGLIYSFELKDNVKFHNNEILKSSDVKFTFERQLKPDTKALMGSLIDMIKGAKDLIEGKATELSGFKIIDDTKFEITLEYPYAPFVPALASPYFGILPQKACEAAGEDWALKTVIGTGAFKFVEFKPDEYLKVEKFADYHGTPAKLDGIDFLLFDNENTRLLEFEQGNIDVTPFPETLYAQYMDREEYKDTIQTITPMGIFNIALNNSSETLKNVKVREALSLAIDRNAICDSIVDKAATAAKTFLPPGMPGYDDKAPAYEYSPEKARALLDEAGYAGQNVKIEAVVRSTTPLQGKFMTAVQDMGKKAGFDISINSVDAATFTDLRNNGNIEMYLSSWYADFVDPDNMLYIFLYSKYSKNYSRNYNNPEVDKMLDDARVEKDEQKRIELYKKIDKFTMHEDYAMLPMYYPKLFHASKPYVKNFVVSGVNIYRFTNVDLEK